jgi:hypothetical protein
MCVCVFVGGGWGTSLSDCPSILLRLPFSRIADADARAHCEHSQRSDSPLCKHMSQQRPHDRYNHYVVIVVSCWLLCV